MERLHDNLYKGLVMQQKLVLKHMQQQFGSCSAG